MYKNFRKMSDGDDEYYEYGSDEEVSSSREDIRKALRLDELRMYSNMWGRAHYLVGNNIDVAKHAQDICGVCGKCEGQEICFCWKHSIWVCESSKYGCMAKHMKECDGGQIEIESRTATF